MDIMIVAMGEMVCAIFIGISLLFLIVEHDAEKSARMLRINTAFVLVWLLADILTYCTGYNYIFTLITYTIGTTVLQAFVSYSEALISENTELNPWLFRVPKVLCILGTVVALVSFVTGKTAVYENGVLKEIIGTPLLVQIIRLFVILYNLVIVISKRKTIGLKSLILLGMFNLTPVVAIVIYNWLEVDYSLIMIAILLMVVILFLQNDQHQRNMDERNAHKALAENSARFFALEDNFVSLYDVELESGRYVWYDRDAFYQRNISDRILSTGGFFDVLYGNIQRVVYEEDREGLYNVQKREAVIQELAENDHFDHYYRVITEKGPVWLKMRLVYKDADKKNVIVGVFNAEEEMAARQKEERAKEELLQINSRLFALEDNFESLYDVEMESGHYDVFVKGDFFKQNVLDKLSVPKDYFAELRGNIEAVIYSEDQEGLYKTLTRESIRSELEQSDHFDYYYRVNTSAGPAWCKMRIVYKDPTKSNVIIGVFNAKDDVEAKQLAEKEAELEEALTFTNYFLDTYISAYYVNFDNLSCQIYKRTEELKRQYPIITNYLDSITQYINQSVHPEDREMLLDAVYPDKMKQVLSDKPEYSHIFRDISDGVEKTYRLQVIRGAEKNHAAFGFIDISEEVEEQQQRLKEVDDARKLLESVAASYSVAYTVHLPTGALKILKLDRIISHKFESFSSFDEAKLSLYNILHDDDRERMMQELEIDTIRKNMSVSESYTTEYRTCIDGITKWHEMNISSIDSDNVVMGFAARDMDIIQHHLVEKQFDEYFALFEVDIDTGMCKVIKNDGGYDAVPVGKAAVYTDYFRNMAEIVDEEASASLRLMADLDYMKQELADEDKRYITYRSEFLPGNKWVDVTVYVVLRHKDGTPAMFTLGFALADSRTTERLELQRQQKEDMQMIGVLASGYNTLYYVNLDEKVFKVYSSSEKFFSRLESASDKKNLDPFAILQKYGASELVHPDDKQLFFGFNVQVVRQRLDGIKKFTVRFRRKSGNDYRWYVMDVVKYEDVDTPANAIAIGFAERDAEIRAEQQQQQLIENARIAAEEANTSKTNFLFNMSHDIRTPMNAITGFTNMAVKYIDNREKTLDCLSKIQQSGSMLLSLINSVLEVSRIESGKATLDDQPGDVYYSFSNIEDTMLELAKTKDIALSFTFGAVRDRYVFADFSRCMRVFVNVISNAVKYTPEGGTVKVTCEQLGEAENGYGRYRYVVSDNGIGMSEEFQKHVFEQFSRENTSTVSGIQGTGLGMSVVKSFVDLMGGTISVQSRLGEGSTFTIVLPLKLQKEEKYTDPVTGEVITTGQEVKSVEKLDFTGKMALLVEDNALNREIAIDILEDAGFLVESAEDGIYAVEKLREKGDAYYDFILMDIQMPRMNGYEATKAIRQMYPDVHIPVIALSANAFSEDKASSLAAGMDDHVAKPININELFNALAKFL